jgi:hypothetical protein
MPTSYKLPALYPLLHLAYDEEQKLEKEEKPKDRELVS